MNADDIIDVGEEIKPLQFDWVINMLKNFMFLTVSFTFFYDILNDV